MIGLDTNVLVRYLVQDDPEQAVLATRLIESFVADAPGFVSQIVLAETIWVLESRYAADAARIGQVVETLLRTEAITVERAEIVWRALRHFRTDHGDFVDTLIAEIAKDGGCRAVYSFDRGAAQRAGMTLLD